MYEEVIDSILGDLTPGYSPGQARVNALRGNEPGSFAAGMGAPVGGASPMQQPTPPMPMPPQPRPMPQQPPQAAPGGPPGGMPMQPPPPRTALPQATGRGFPQPAPPQPNTPDISDLNAQNDPLLRQEAALRQRQQDAFAEQARLSVPGDRTAMEEAYGKQAEGGNRKLLLALAAQQAGKGFEPFQEHALKQAAAATAPMKMTGGTMTPEGFIADPGHAEEMNLKRADANLKAIDAALQQNLTQQERRRLEQQQKEWQASMQRSQLGMQYSLGMQASADRNLATNLAHQDRVAAAGAKGTKLTAKEQSDLDAHNAMSQGLAGAVASLSKVKSDTGTGWVAGLAQEKLPGGESLVAKMRDPSVKAAVQQLTYVTDAIRHDRFGSALTVTEKASAAQYLPSPYDDIPRMLEKAKGLQTLVALNNQRLVAKGQAPETITPGAQAQPGAAAPAAPQVRASPAPGPVRVNTPAEAAKLAPGTPFITPDGQRRVRQ